MSDADVLRRVARSIAVHLEHLREYRGVHYVPAGPIPPDLFAPSDDAELIIDVTAEGEPAPLLASAPQDERPQPVAALAPAAVARDSRSSWISRAAAATRRRSGSGRTDNAVRST